MRKAETLLAEARARGLAALDARLLLQAANALTHEQLIADPDAEISVAAEVLFQSTVERRLAHEPVSRILGVREFFGRSFRVTPDVLDPRPDTECVVQLALDLTQNSVMPAEAGIPLEIAEKRGTGLRRGDGHNLLSFLDIGTGSGAIAVTLAAERPKWRGVALDVSAAALAVAKSNAEALGVAEQLEFVEDSWFPASAAKFDLIISNPPYIAQVEIQGLAPDVRLYDPHLALIGGEDGMDPYRTIAEKAAAWLKPDGYFVVEIGAGQASDIEAIFLRNGFRLVEARRDLGGHMRGLAFKLAV